jgi:uncharacterized membrane protein
MSNGLKNTLGFIVLMVIIYISLGIILGSAWFPPTWPVIPVISGISILSFCLYVILVKTKKTKFLYALVLVILVLLGIAYGLEIDLL